MEMWTYLRRHPVFSLVLFQGVFLFLQFSIFYPCLTGGSELNLFQKRTVEFHNEDGVKGNLTGESGVQAAAPVEIKGPLPPVEAKDKYQANWESLDARPIPEWYDDAKIGIFLHWGVFSVPSYIGNSGFSLSEWFWFYWKNEQFVRPRNAKHARKLKGFLERRKEASRSVKAFMKKNYPPTWHYTDFAPQFTATLFDPDHWANIFKASGAKYVILTSKHHDGFALWDAPRSWNWNAVRNGPHRDLVGDLGKAVKGAGLKYGLYHSLYEWFHPLYEQDKKTNFSSQVFVNEKLMPELVDLVKKYKPDILWSDGEFEAPSAYWKSKEFLAWLYNKSPVGDKVITNDRWGDDALCKHGGYLTCQDRYNPAKDGKNQTRKWENCMTIDRESWGYRRNAELKDYYTMEGLIELLAQTVSHGGNLLMNVGPTADGRIPPIFEERLRSLGVWLKINGDAIYGTKMWTTTVDSTNKHVYYTKKGDNVYAILTTWPDDNKLVLGSPKPSEKTTVMWQGYSTPIKYTTEKSGMVLMLPNVSLSKIPCEWAWTFKLTGLNS